MDENRQTPSEAQPEPAAKPRKRPYCKPEFIFERAFETLALTCGKLSRTQQQCKFNIKVS